MSTIIYFYIAKVVVNAQSNLELLIVSIAAAVGCLLACKISDHFAKDKIYINVIMSDDIEEMKRLRDYLASKHIVNIASESYTKDWHKTIAINAYAETKNDSIAIDDYMLQSDKKFKRVIQIA